MPRVDGIAVVTRDMAEALAFYRLLGFRLPPSAGSDRYVTVVSGGLRLSWSTREADAPHAGVGCGLVLRCAGPGEVDALCEAVRRSGHPVACEPFDAPWGARHCRLLDPDGNAVELFAPLP